MRSIFLVTLAACLFAEHLFAVGKAPPSVLCEPALTSPLNLSEIRDRLDSAILSKQANDDLHEVFLRIHNDFSRHGQNALKDNLYRFWKDFVNFARKKGGEWVDTSKYPLRPDWAGPTTQGLQKLIRNKNEDFWKSSILPEVNARQMAAILYGRIANLSLPKGPRTSLERFAFEADLMGKTLSSFETAYIVDERTPMEILMAEGFYSNVLPDGGRRSTLWESMAQEEKKRDSTDFFSTELFPEKSGSYLFLRRNFGSEHSRHEVMRSISPKQFISIDFNATKIPVEVYEYRIKNIVGVDNPFKFIEPSNSDDVILTNFIGLSQVAEYRKLIINGISHRNELLHASGWQPFMSAD